MATRMDIPNTLKNRAYGKAKVKGRSKNRLNCAVSDSPAKNPVCPIKGEKTKGKMWLSEQGENHTTHR